MVKPDQIIKGEATYTLDEFYEDLKNLRKEWKKYVNWLYNLEYGIFGIPKPDYTFILKTSADSSLKQSGNVADKIKQSRRKSYLGDSRKQDIHEKNINHLKNAFDSYLMAAKEFPNDFFDLIVTSPPYADSRSKTYGGIKPDKYVAWFLPRTEQTG